MKVGDLVTDYFYVYDGLGVILTQPRLSEDCVGVMEGDVYEVVDVLCPDGCTRQFTTDELRIVSESR